MVSMKSHRPGHEDGLSTAILLHCLGEHFSFSPGRAVHGHTPSPTHAGTPTLALAVLVTLAFVGQLLSPPMLRSFWSFVVLVPLCELTAPPGESAVATSTGRLRRAWGCIRRPAQQPYSSQSRAVLERLSDGMAIALPLLPHSLPNPSMTEGPCSQDGHPVRKRAFSSFSSRQDPANQPCPSPHNFLSQ